ncbi:prolyl oligopeptidase family serine peptidase [Microbacterium sp.]|uniref:prolyl oligopeptidase family serine peptidase n=1 Tax=Microbacterium sp. TaxID=51671 RepID=UPI0025F21276|nr:prolyl oligopeptidase family serine peptidase [Microbacterium sp.]
MVPVLPFGSWPSPLTAAWAAKAAPRLEGGALVADEVWWGASVPDEGGRTTVRRRRPDGRIDEMLPAPWNARSRVHEYGGGSWVATENGDLFFVAWSDQRVWMLRPGAAPHALTPADPDVRYGGLRWQGGTLLAVQERHGHGPRPSRAIVAIGTEGDLVVTELVSDSAFVAQPALSPGGDRLAWVAWDHPHMPWDATELRVGRIENGTVSEWTTVTSGESAALQPEWISDDDLRYLDDTTGRWNLWQVRLDAGLPRTQLAPADADTGGPLWMLGARWHAALDDGAAVAVRTDGDDALVRISAHGEVIPVDLPARSRLNIESTDGKRVLVSGSAPGTSGLWLIEASGSAHQVVGEPPPSEILPYLPTSRAVSFDGAHGPVHAFDYPPTHPHVRAPEGERPPYVVLVHGGPTAHVAGVADSKTAFFTSRGIGVLDVNYGGSSGYGRAYRERLRGQWGIVDVEDVASAAAGLAAEGRADPARVAIEGGSAGGWTVLAALVGTDVFGAGISRYGVGDARALAADTHDFEAHYLDGLIGPLPESDAVYRARSPLSRPEGFRVPLLILQGAEDAVVPPAQAEVIRDALSARGVPHAFVLYEGEGHGFRRAETIVHALESELAFLGQVFGFETPGVASLELTRQRE